MADTNKSKHHTNRLTIPFIAMLIAFILYMLYLLFSPITEDQAEFNPTELQRAEEATQHPRQFDASKKDLQTQSPSPGN